MRSPAAEEEDECPPPAPTLLGGNGEDDATGDDEPDTDAHPSFLPAAVTAMEEQGSSAFELEDNIELPPDAGAARTGVHYEQACDAADRWEPPVDLNNTRNPDATVLWHRVISTGYYCSRKKKD